MIGFDVTEELKDLKKNLLYNHHVFTGEAKPNVIRLLPSLALTKDQANEFLEALQNEIEVLKPPTSKGEEAPAQKGEVSKEAPALKGVVV